MELTSVVVAQSKSKSLRTTIPVGIARQFGISQETQLGWEIEARDNELRIVVHPIRQEEVAPTGGSRKTGRGKKAV